MNKGIKKLGINISGDVAKIYLYICENKGEKGIINLCCAKRIDQMSLKSRVQESELTYMGQMVIYVLILRTKHQSDAREQTLHWSILAGNKKSPW